MSAAHVYMEKYYGKLDYKDGLMVDEKGRNLEGEITMVDTLSKDIGVAATIFVKSGDDFKRISTNILKDSGERAIGTTLGKDSPAYTNVSKGIKYVGKANILKKSYFTAYDPIINESGEVIGILFVGVPENESTQQIKIF